MNRLRGVLAELAGLFIDDRPFAAGIALCVALVALVTLVPRISGGSALWVGPIFFAGLCGVLLASVARSSKKRT